MEAKTTRDSRDLTVHLRDAALFVLLRWRMVLAAALVGAILLTVGGYWRDLRRYQASQSEPEPLTALTAESRARVAAAMGYRAAYRRVCAYNETAPLMQVDPGAAPTRRMRLLVTGEGCWSAACLYREYVVSESAYRELAADATQAAYLAELVTVEVETEPSDQPPRQVFLTVHVIAPTEETCNRLSSVVRRRVEEVSAAVREAVGEHRWTWAFDRYAVLQDETVATHQQTYLERQTALQEQAATAYRALSAGEEEYMQRLLGQASAADPATPPTINRMAWLWGFLLGALVGLGWLALRYLFYGKVLSVAEVISRHDTAVVGVLGERSKRMMDRLRDTSEDAALVAQRLALSAAAQGVERLYISTAQPLPADFVMALEEAGIALQAGASPCTDGEAARQLVACDGFVCAAAWGCTAHRRVAEELALAQQWCIPILGVLLLQ